MRFARALAGSFIIEGYTRDGAGLPGSRSLCRYLLLRANWPFGFAKFIRSHFPPDRASALASALRWLPLFCCVSVVRVSFSSWR